MKIFVCIKQVPDTEAKMKLKPDGSGIDPTGVKWVLNPYDEIAVEEAIQQRDKAPGSQVLVLTVGPKTRVIESLRTALAMGADDAVVVHSESDLDSLSTAQALAKVVQQEGGADLILTGKLAIDDNQACVPQMMAQVLGVPHSTVISKLVIENSKATAQRDVEGGSKEILDISLPAVIAVNKGLNTPRYASLPGIMKAKKKVIKEIDISSLGLISSKRVSLSKFELPAEKPPVKIVSGDATTQVSELVKLLRDEAKVL